MQELTKTCTNGMVYGHYKFFFISNNSNANKTLRTPLLAAANHNDEAITDTAKGIDTLRLFSDLIDFSENRGSGWRTLVILLWNLSVSSPDGAFVDDTRRKSLIIWMLRSSASDIKKAFRNGAFASLIPLLSVHDAEEVDDLLSSITDNFMNARHGYGKYSAIQILMNFVLNLMLNKGANLHLVSDQFMFSVESETLTSLALYSSFMFATWRDALLRSSVDLESFVEDEVQQSPLRDVGWNKESLLA